MYRSSNIFEDRKYFMECSRSSYLKHALYDAVIDGDIMTVEYLLVSKKVNPNFLLKDYDAAPLHTAAGIGTEELSLKLVGLLLENSAHPNIKTSDGTTPLMISCLWGRPIVSNLLLQCGADPWVEDADGKNALEYALENGYYKIYESLTKFKFNTTISSDESVVSFYNSKKGFYIVSEPETDLIQSFIKYNIHTSNERIDFSDINSEINCMEFYPLNTAFLNSSKNSVSSSGTFFSVTHKNETFSIHSQDITTLHNKRILETNDNNLSTSSVSSISQVSIISYGTDQIKEELKKNNINHGPVTKTTKKVYQNLIKKVVRGKKNNPCQNDEFSNYPEILRSTIKENGKETIMKWLKFEDLMARHFSNEKKLWRGGKEKQFFTYLLLDPFITNDLPSRRTEMSDSEIWKTFILSIFYIGKGKNSRPFSHLFEALKSNVKKTVSKKVLRIQKIWNKSAGIICMHLFHNIISAEAHTREAAMIDAIGLSNLTNIQSGEYYGIVKNWSFKQKQQLGIVLLNKGLQIYLAEGERQIFSTDLV